MPSGSGQIGYLNEAGNLFQYERPATASVTNSLEQPQKKHNHIKQRDVQKLDKGCYKGNRWRKVR